MTRQEKLILDLVETLEGAVEKFNERVPSMQTQMYKNALDLLSDLELTNDKPKRLKVSLKNAKIIAKIKANLRDAIVNDEYKKKVEEFLVTWDKVDEINGKYFSSITKTWKPGTVFEEIKLQTISSVKEKLLGSGMQANVVNKLEDILTQNISRPVTYADLTEQVRTFLVDDDNGAGALAKYSKTLVNDTIMGYNRQYHAAATQDLGMDWFMYVGTLKETSREFCKKMIEAKQGCMKFFHRSQIKDFLNGYICGERVEMNPKTKLPVGMKATTTVQSFIDDDAGGHGCNHAVIGVDEAVVPDDLVQQFKGKF